MASSALKLSPVEYIADAKSNQSAELVKPIPEPQMWKLPVYDDYVKVHLDPTIGATIAAKDKSPLPANLYGLKPSKIKTQKAQGIRVLMSAGDNIVAGLKSMRHLSSEVFLLPHTLPPHYWNGNGWFARPCPTVPRHGFVDSQVVFDQEHLQFVLNSALAEDPNAEVIVMPYLSGAYSGVITSAGVTFGLGNDGVTGATSNVITIPTPGTSPGAWNGVWRQHFQRFELKSPTHTYGELVEHNGTVVMVQLRDGPEPQASANYIPKKTTITKVVTPKLFEGLLGWEKEVKKLKEAGTVGVVIYISGASLSSHWAVHAIAAGIPVITDHEPHVGDILLPSDNQPAPMTTDDWRSLAKRLTFWMAQDYFPNLEPYNYVGPTNTLVTALGTAQTMGQWGPEPHLIDLRAQAMVSLSRALLAACMGEVRHWNGSGPGRFKKRRHSESVRGVKVTMNDGRNAIYRRMLAPLPWGITEQLLGLLRRDFRRGGWGRVMRRNSKSASGTGYGGPKWGDVAERGEELVKALRAFRHAPGPGNWSKVTMAANAAIHTVHNGGFALNKWFSGHEFTMASTAPALCFCNDFAVKQVLKHLQEA